MVIFRKAQISECSMYSKEKIAWVFSVRLLHFPVHDKPGTVVSSLPRQFPEYPELSATGGWVRPKDVLSVVIESAPLSWQTNALTMLLPQILFV